MALRSRGSVVSMQRAILSVALMLVLAGCKDSPAIQFGSFEKVRAAALDRGCVERVGAERRDKVDPERSEYFECERVVGPRCECLITFSIERWRKRDGRPEESDPDRGISHLTFQNEYCPRATAGAIALDLIKAAFPGRDHAVLETAVSAPPVKMELETEVRTYRTLAGIGLFVAWNPVTDEGVWVPPEQAEDMFLYVWPPGLRGAESERPLDVLPSPSSARRRVCPRVDLEKRRDQERAEPPKPPIELPYQGPVVR